MERMVQDVVDLESPDDLALADKMKKGRDQIIAVRVPVSEWIERRRTKASPCAPPPTPE